MSRNARLGVAATAVLVAVIAFIALRPNDKKDTSTSASAPATTTMSGSSGKPAANVTTIRVAGGQPVGGVQSITVKKGDQIRFKVVDDKGEHVHLHGYDIEKSVIPSQPVSYSVPATIDGVFVIEIEDTGVQIGKLTVEP